MMRPHRSRLAVVGTALALVAGLGGTAYAQGDVQARRGAHRHGGIRGGVPGLGRLNLTDAQREQVREVMQRHRGELQEAGRRLRDAHAAQQDAVQAVPLDEGLIRSTAQALATAQTDLALLRARMHNDVWALLTPDQQDQASKLRAERESRLKDRQRRQPRQEG